MAIQNSSNLRTGFLTSVVNPRLSSIRVDGTGGFGSGSGGTEMPFMWVLASNPAVMPVSVSMPFAFGRGKVSGSFSSLKKEKEKELDMNKDKERDREKRKRRRASSSLMTHTPCTRSATT